MQHFVIKNIFLIHRTTRVQACSELPVLRHFLPYVMHPTKKCQVIRADSESGHTKIIMALSIYPPYRLAIKKSHDLYFFSSISVFTLQFTNLASNFSVMIEIGVEVFSKNNTLPDKHTDRCKQKP